MIVRENEVRDVQNNQDIEWVDGPTAIVSIDRLAHRLNQLTSEVMYYFKCVQIDPLESIEFTFDTVFSCIVKNT